MQSQDENALALMCEYWRTTIRSDPIFSRTPSRLTLRFEDDPENKKTALVWGFQRPTIEISRGFLADIREEIKANADVLEEACLGGLQLTTDSSEVKDRLMRCIFDLSASFVLLHEVSHILCGHLGELWSSAKNKQRALPFDEAYLGMEADNVKDTAAAPFLADDMIFRRYYREIQADNTALQEIMRSSPRAPIKDFLSILGLPPPQHTSSMAEMEGNGRIAAFRLLIATSWLIVRLVERKRDVKIRERCKEHPLPGARLLAAVCTVAEQFAELTELTIDEVGRKVQSLSSENAENLTIFLRQVMRPILKAPWPVRNTSAASEGYEVFSIWILKELGNILGQRGPETPPGKELERLDGLRREMNKRLAAHHYFNYTLIG